jgi:hypothetical protein
MIRYTLKCDQGHDFESWFASATAYDSLRKAGHVMCANCGSVKVEKALMAPAVSHSKKQAAPPQKTQQDAQKDTQQKLAALRREVEEKSDYVGKNFVTEARAMHDGDAPERPIWGEARIDEAKALLDDGVPVMPLPFIPKSKTN